MARLEMRGVWDSVHVAVIVFPGRLFCGERYMYWATIAKRFRGVYYSGLRGVVLLANPDPHT